MSTIIKYGDYDFNGQPTPFITRSEEAILNGEKWGTKEVFNLRGKLSGCEYVDLISAQKDLIIGFGQDFQNLEILQDFNSLFFKSGVKVDSVNFPSNKYVGVIDYEIQLSHFPTDYFTTQYGITNPVDSWDFNEGEDGLLNITHTISCKGFNTHSGANNAFQNARNFVNLRTGDQNMVNPHFICKNTFPNFYPCLDSFSERIDRVGGNYSITENYISDLEGSGLGVLRYSIDLDEGIDSFSSATVQGNIDGCKNQEMSAVRDRFNNFPIFNIVADTYNDYFGSVDLNSEPLTSSIQEDQLNKKLTFNYTFNNDNSSTTSLDVTTQISDDNGFISVNVNGNVKSRGDIYDQWVDIQARFDTVDIFGIANNSYVEFLGGGGEFPLSPAAQSSGVTQDQFTPQISFNASFSNKDILPAGFDSFSRNISFSPSVRKIKPVPLFDQNGTYDIVDLLFDGRAKISVNLNGIGQAGQSAEGLTATMKSEANFLLQKYGTTDTLKLESYNLSTGTLSNYSLAATWSFDTSNKVIVGSNYDTVSTLKLK